MKLLRNITFIYCLLGLNVSSLLMAHGYKEKKKSKPLSIILLIGDGMGLSQISTTFFYDEKQNSFKRFENIGLMNTSSASHKITDSAAGATAFSSGVKTYNGAIGVDIDTVNVETMFEKVTKLGYKTGLVATSSVVHATPAAFYAHTKHRSLYEDIALQLALSPTDFFAGGGLKFFQNRKDGQDLLAVLKTRGVEMNIEKLPIGIDVKANQDQKYGYLLSEDGMPTMLENRGDFLPKATKVALDYLSSHKKGFFLMVEGSQIDWAGHANEADYLIEEMRDFNATINVALDYASNNENTLVIVTADHETGGFTLAGHGNDYSKLEPRFSTGGHSSTLIPVFAFGAGAENFRGIYENTEIFDKINELLSR